MKGRGIEARMLLGTRKKGDMEEVRAEEGGGKVADLGERGRGEWEEMGVVEGWGEGMFAGVRGGGGERDKRRRGWDEWGRLWVGGLRECKGLGESCGREGRRGWEEGGDRNLVWKGGVVMFGPLFKEKMSSKYRATEKESLVLDRGPNPRKKPEPAFEPQASMPTRMPKLANSPHAARAPFGERPEDRAAIPRLSAKFNLKWQKFLLEEGPSPLARALPAATTEPVLRFQQGGGPRKEKIHPALRRPSGPFCPAKTRWPHRSHA